MPNAITNRPQGLGSVLGLRDMGAVPRELRDDLQGVIDVTEFMLVDRTTLNAQNTFSSATTWNAIAVPPGELWRVHQWGFRCGPLLAGERVGIGLYIADPQIAPVTGAFRANHTGEFCIGSIGQMFWAKAGAQLGVYMSDFASSGTIGVETTVLVSRFRV